MKKIKIDFFDEYVYHEKLDNGLEVYILPNQSAQDTYVSITSKYGGVNHPFMYNNKYVKVPSGIAHFLEHELFNVEDMIDPFTFFGKSGTYCNASTNYFNTSYYFAGNQNYEENLNYLLDFIQKPNFNDEAVLKEKGIITEEIKMYEDMPDRLIYEKILYNLFNNHPIKYSIGGTVNDIKKITKEDLYKCYETFYQPSNMFLVITGNVDVENTISLIKENQASKKFNNTPIKRKNIKESDTVFKDMEVIDYNIATPYVAYGIKIPIKPFKNIDKKKRNIYLSTIMNLLFDDTSLFYEKAKEEGIIDTTVLIETIDTDEHKVFILLFKSNKYEEIIKRVDEELKNIVINSEDLERKKKVYISYILYTLDSIGQTNKLIVNDIILFDKVYYNIYELLNEMNVEELKKIISKMDITNKSIYIIKSTNS